MKLAKKLTASCLAVAMMITCTSLSFATENNETSVPGTSVQLSEAEILAAVSDLIEAEKEYYDIKDINVANVVTEEKSDGTTETTCSIEFAMQLKAQSLEDLPYIKGLLNTVGVDSIDACTVENVVDADVVKDILSPQIADISASVATSAITTNGTMREDALLNRAVSLAATETVAMAMEYSEYIGATSKITFDVLICTDSSGNIIEVLGLGGTEGPQYTTFPLSDYFPQSEQAMMASAQSDLISMVSTKIELELQSDLVEPQGALYPYKRLSARNYAMTYSSEASASSKCPHGNTRIDLSKYNSDYIYYCHQDCANYVSQAMAAGQCPQDANWRYDAANKSAPEAWRRVTKMYEYFTGMQYWSASSFTNCNAGGIIINENTNGTKYHVNMCVLNDSVNRAYAAHNSDHNNKAYGSNYWGSDTVYYFVFTVREDE